jgi:ATP-dependent DNA helicase DinG
VSEAAYAVEYAGRDLRLAFPLDAPAAKTTSASARPKDPNRPINPNRRYADRELAQMPLLAKTFAEAIEAVNKLAALLDAQKERHDELEKLFDRSNEVSERIEAFLKAEGEISSDDNQDQEAPRKVPRVRWAEISNQGASFNTTPLLVGPLFKDRIAKEKRAWIFTSATLSVRNGFEHYQGDMGLEDATTATWDSPFDYGNNALLYVPQNMPETNAPNYAQACIDALYPAVVASKGRAFLLFTNLRTMQQAATEVKRQLKDDGLDYPIFLQGEAAKGTLLERFRLADNGILIGSQSFWEGVDVKGDKLSLVVIDRLPFAAPDDPLLAARIDYMNRIGGNPFMDYQLPRAVINLKQGAGRLIRDEKDRGVLMICDTRLVDKPYGKQIWRSLPPMKRSRLIEDVQAFFA